MTIDDMIRNYVRVRDKKEALEKAHKEQLKPFREMLSRIEGYLLEALNQAKLNSMNSVHGTAYKTLRTSTKVVDWPATLTFIRENEAWDLLEARVSKLAAQALIEDTKLPIPGVESTSELVVNVRRAGAGDS